MFSQDYDAIYRVSKELTEEILSKKPDIVPTEELKYGAMWKTPWAPNLDWDEENQWPWRQFEIHLPRTDMKVRARWLAPVQVYQDGKWVDCTTLEHTDDGTDSDANGICYAAFGALEDQLYKVQKKVCHGLHLALSNMELLKSVSGRMVPGWDDDHTTPLLYAAHGWSVLCTDKLGLHIILPADCLLDSKPAPIDDPRIEAGAIVIHKDGHGPDFYGVGELTAPMWKAIVSWAVLFGIKQREAYNFGKNYPDYTIDPTVGPVELR